MDEALDTDPRDAHLIHRRAQLRGTLARWQDDEAGLEEALEGFERAFEQHGGRVDPATHQPGPVFFFDWGKATYEFARAREDRELYEAAHDRLATGYEMRPRGARHQVASALMARCRFGVARAADDPEAYEQVIERYGTLADQAPFALEGEDQALWARALFSLAEHRDDASLYREAFERMRRAYEST